MQSPLNHELHPRLRWLDHGQAYATLQNFQRLKYCNASMRLSLDSQIGRVSLAKAGCRHGPLASEKSLAFIGNPRRAMFSWKPDVSCRGFSITRLEGSRWRLRRTRSVYGESTKEGPELALSKGVNPVENFGTFKQRVRNHEVLILQPSRAELEDVYGGLRV